MIKANSVEGSLLSLYFRITVHHTGAQAGTKAGSVEKNVFTGSLKLCFFIQSRPTSSEMVPPAVSWFLPQQGDPSQTWAQTKLIEAILQFKFHFLKWCQADTKTNWHGLCPLERTVRVS